MEIKALNELKMKAKKITKCWNHSLVLFEEANGNEVLYSLGTGDKASHKYFGVAEDKLGDSESQKKKPFREITTLSDTKILDIACSERGSLVIMQGE